ncbi:hypothetical protein GCM10009784_16750 [Arthrobacter parietis]|uniref:Uncharacterized protein n=2 Tax=Arthrobacter TaxID=1663 RepID=A0ABT6CUU9_9MICC|nr:MULTISPECIES: hypothetical protein [Arthrobacter]MDF9277335.1 hypothetical protein [Arthrobacter vasquezii]
MSEEPQHEEVPREHSEQPAEGDRAQNPADTGTHSQDPAEGADSGPETNGTDAEG